MSKSKVSYSSPEAERWFKWFDSACAEAKKSPVGKFLTRRHWEVTHTGGGCMAWEQVAPDGEFYVWITDDDAGLGEDRKDLKASWCVGLYHRESGWVCHEVKGINKAVRWCEEALADPRAMFERARSNGWAMEELED
jgi:hypothetical protein